MHQDQSLKPHEKNYETNLHFAFTHVLFCMQRQQKAIYHFARSLGSVNTNNIKQAAIELDSLNFLHNVLLKQKDEVKEAAQVDIQIKTSQAWIEFKKGNNENALLLMQTAADMEDKTEKHPVTPGEVIPARELPGDMLLQMNKYNEALNAFEQDLKTHPNRFNGLYGAAVAAEKSGTIEKAVYYYKQLSIVTSGGKSNRSELADAKMFMASHKN